jgi:hypothetical protein
MTRNRGNTMGKSDLQNTLHIHNVVFLEMHVLCIFR